MTRPIKPQAAPIDRIGIALDVVFAALSFGTVIVAITTSVSQSDFLGRGQLASIVGCLLLASAAGRALGKDAILKALHVLIAVAITVAFNLLMARHLDAPMPGVGAAIVMIGYYGPRWLFIPAGVMTLGHMSLIILTSDQVDQVIASRSLLSALAVVVITYTVAARRDELVQSVGALTKTRQELAEKSQALDELLVKRNQLFGIAAHELRTPAASLHMLANDSDTNAWINARGDVRTLANDLLATIDDLRLINNQDGKLPMRSETFHVLDLNASIAATIASVTAITRVEYQQINALPQSLFEQTLEADIYRLRAVISNIVRNACLHAQANKVWTVSRLYMDASGLPFLEWSVCDDGVGIPDSEIETLFEMGERGNTEATGSGMGLFIARQWVRELGGEVQYRRRHNRQSIFDIRIPLKTSTLEQRPEPVTASSKAAIRAEEMAKQLRVLLVEDDATLRRLSKRMLEAVVAHFDTARDGETGLQRFENHEYDLLLVDYFMPGITGAELIQTLRARGYRGAIIGVTAATIGEQPEEMIDAGADLVLAKPLTLTTFFGAIAQLEADEALPQPTTEPT